MSCETDLRGFCRHSCIHAVFGLHLTMRRILPGLQKCTDRMHAMPNSWFYRKICLPLHRTRYRSIQGFTRSFVCSLLIGLGDTQAITNMAFAIPALSIMADSISCYHYNLICYLSLIAGCSYVSSATVVNHHSLRTAPHLIWLRLILAARTFGCTVALLSQ